MSADLKRCRACLCYGNHSYDLESSEVLRTFIFCISFPVKINDFLPKALCNKCYELLIKFNEFKRLCIDSEQILSDEEKYFVTKEQHEHLKISNCDPNREIKLEVSQIEIDIVKEEFDDTIANDDRDFNLDSISFDGHSSATFSNTEISHRIKIEKECISKPDIVRNKCISKVLKKTRRNSDEKYVPSLKNTPKTNSDIVLECSICDSKFKNKRNLKTHEAAHHKKKVEYKCNVCNQIFKLGSTLKNHKRIHAQPKDGPKTCTTCGKAFKYAYLLANHMNGHLQKQTHVCHICAKSFIYRTSLNTHLLYHKNDGIGTHECKYCKKKYFTSGQLRAHIKLTHLPRTIACEVCGKLVSTKGDLRSHMLVHSDAKPHVCNICNKAYARKKLLKVHIRTHTGERPFPCNVCNRRFLSRETLVEHQRIHTGEKRYKCKICDRAFSQSGTLWRHLNTHKS